MEVLSNLLVLLILCKTMLKILEVYDIAQNYRILHRVFEYLSQHNLNSPHNGYI
jgi:hypothetical protein